MVDTTSMKGIKSASAGPKVVKDKTERMKPRKTKAADVAASLSYVLPRVTKDKTERMKPKRDGEAERYKAMEAMPQKSRSPQRYAQSQGTFVTKDKTERMTPPARKATPRVPGAGPDAKRSPQRFAKATGKPIPGTLKGRRGSSERKAY